MTYGFLVLLALFMRFGPDVPFRRMLNRHLVERPIDLVLSHKRVQYLALVIGAVMLLIGGEWILLFGPELLLAYAADVALYVDVVVIAAASASWTRAHAVLTRWRPRFGRNLADKRKRNTPRTKRTQRTPSELSKANDDDDGDGPAIGFITVTRPFAIAA